MPTRSWCMVSRSLTVTAWSFEGVEVDGDAVRGADLVLPPVPAADRAGVVEVGVPPLAQRRRQVARLRRQVGVARQRQHRRLDRREPVVQAQHRPLLQVALGVRRLVLGVGVEQEHQRAAVHAGRGLDHPRDEPLARLLVQVGHVLPGRLLVGGQVVVGPVGDAFQLAPLGAGEVKLVLDVHRALGVVRELFLRVLILPQVLGRGCRGRCTRRSAGRSSTRASPRRCPGGRRTPSPSARTPWSGR